MIDHCAILSYSKYFHIICILFAKSSKWALTKEGEDLTDVLFLWCSPKTVARRAVL